MRRSVASVTLVIALAGAVATTGSVPATASSSVLAPQRADVTVSKVLARGLDAPWGLAFLPDGSALVTERDTARVRRVAGRRRARRRPSAPCGALSPAARAACSGSPCPPDRTRPSSSPTSPAARDNRVVRIAWDGRRLGRQTAILTGIPKNTYHDGGRLLVGPDSTLFVGTGDAGDPSRSQDRGSLAGKILRVTFDGKAGARQPVRAGHRSTRLGHRNVQGLAFDSAGRLWASEFGQSDVDELNLIQPGGNYGWPVHEGAVVRLRVRQPEGRSGPPRRPPPPAASPSGTTSRTSRRLRGERLWQVVLDGTDAGQAARRRRRATLGRLRTIATAPDGSLWLVTSNTDGRGIPPPRRRPDPPADGRPTARVGACPPPRSSSGSSPSSCSLFAPALRRSRA